MCSYNIYLIMSQISPSSPVLYPLENYASIYLLLPFHIIHSILFSLRQNIDLRVLPLLHWGDESLVLCSGVYCCCRKLVWMRLNHVGTIARDVSATSQQTDTAQTLMSPLTTVQGASWSETTNTSWLVIQIQQQCWPRERISVGGLI